MNKKTFLNLTVLNAKFEIDVDENEWTLGSQETFIKFKYFNDWF